MLATLEQEFKPGELILVERHGDREARIGQITSKSFGENLRIPVERVYTIGGGDSREILSWTEDPLYMKDYLRTSGQIVTGNEDVFRYFNHYCYHSDLTRSRFSALRIANELGINFGVNLDRLRKITAESLFNNMVQNLSCQRAMRENISETQTDPVTDIDISVDEQKAIISRMGENEARDFLGRLIDGGIFGHNISMTIGNGTIDIDKLFSFLWQKYKVELVSTKIPHDIKETG